MKRISRNLTAAALASSLTMAGVAAASAEENTEFNGNDPVGAVVTAGENDTEGENGTEEAGEAEGENGTGETGKTEDENGAGETGKTEEEKPGQGDNKPGQGENKPGQGENKPGKDNADKKEKSSFDDFKSKLSSEDGKPTKLGIAGIVIGVLGAIAAAVPAAAQALNIKLPF